MAEHTRGRAGAMRQSELQFHCPSTEHPQNMASASQVQPSRSPTPAQRRPTAPRQRAATLVLRAPMWAILPCMASRPVPATTSTPCSTALPSRRAGRRPSARSTATRPSQVRSKASSAPTARSWRSGRSCVATSRSSLFLCLSLSARRYVDAFR